MKILVERKPDEFNDELEKRGNKLIKKIKKEFPGKKVDYSMLSGGAIGGLMGGIRYMAITIWSLSEEEKIIAKKFQEKITFEKDLPVSIT